MANLIAQDAARSCRAEPIVISPPAIAFITPRWCASLDTIGAIGKSKMSDLMLKSYQGVANVWTDPQSKSAGSLAHKFSKTEKVHIQSCKMAAIRFGIIGFILLTLITILIIAPSYAGTLGSLIFHL